MMVNTVSNRLSLLGTETLARGRFAVIGSPESFDVIGGESTLSQSEASRQSFAGRLMPSERSFGVLPDNMSGFVSSGYELGRSATRFGGSDEQQSWHIASGLEIAASDRLTIGGASALIDGRSALLGDQARVRTGQALAYGSYRLGGGFYVAGLGSASVSDIRLNRVVDGGYHRAFCGQYPRDEL